MSLRPHRTWAEPDDGVHPVGRKNSVRTPTGFTYCSRPIRCCRSDLPTLVFCRCMVRVPAKTPAILTEICGFLQSLQTNASLVPLTATADWSKIPHSPVTNSVVKWNTNKSSAWTYRAEHTAVTWQTWSEAAGWHISSAGAGLRLPHLGSMYLVPPKRQ
jgi:hypothetical protein